MATRLTSPPPPLPLLPPQLTATPQEERECHRKCVPPFQAQKSKIGTCNLQNGYCGCYGAKEVSEGQVKKKFDEYGSFSMRLPGFLQVKQDSLRNPGFPECWTSCLKQTGGGESAACWHTCPPGSHVVRASLPGACPPSNSKPLYCCRAVRRHATPHLANGQNVTTQDSAMLKCEHRVLNKLIRVSCWLKSSTL